jgi:hypothetical protein
MKVCQALVPKQRFKLATSAILFSTILELESTFLYSVLEFHIVISFGIIMCNIGSHIVYDIFALVMRCNFLFHIFTLLDFKLDASFNKFINRKSNWTGFNKCTVVKL